MNPKFKYLIIVLLVFLALIATLVFQAFAQIPSSSNGYENNDLLASIKNTKASTSDGDQLNFDTSISENKANSNATSETQINIVNIGNGIPQTADTRVVFTFDDGDETQFQVAYPILKDAGIRATVYVVRDFAESNSSEYMSVDQLRTLYQSGWDISNHSSTHEHIAQNDQPENLMRSKQIFLENQNWIIQEIGDRGAYHAAYPFGNYSNRLAEILSELGIISARTTVRNNADNQTIYGDSMYLLPIQPLEGEDAYQTAIDAINNAISTKRSVIFMIHKIKPIITDYALTVDDFTKIVNFVKEYSDSNKITTMTMSEWTQIPNTPEAPNVSFDEKTNKVIGINETMEYSLNGSGFVSYKNEEFSNIDFTESSTIVIRYAQTQSAPHGLPKSLFISS